jgi:hypothetical protein
MPVSVPVMRSVPPVGSGWKSSSSVSRVRRSVKLNASFPSPSMYRRMADTYSGVVKSSESRGK